MKAVITAGGKGTRLRPITNTLNKHLVPICNKPLLFQAIENVKDIGIKDILININADDNELPAIVGDGSRWDVRITYIRQDQPKGLAHVLQLAEPFIGQEAFVFYYGDNVLAGGLEPHLKAFNEHGSSCHLCLVKVEAPEQFGVAVVDGDKVVRTVEKPQEFVSDLAITGIQFYTREIFEAIKHIKPTPPKPPRTIAEMDIPPANQWLIDNGFKVTCSEITLWWKDTGRPKDLLAANRLLLTHMPESRAALHLDARSEITGTLCCEEGVSIEDSTIIGPCILGRNVKISGSRIGPHVAIGDNAVIEHSEIEESIVMADATIQNLNHRISQSIIGRGARLAGERAEKDIRLIVGDHSQILVHD